MVLFTSCLQLCIVVRGLVNGKQVKKCIIMLRASFWNEVMMCLCGLELHVHVAEVAYLWCT